VLAGEGGEPAAGLDAGELAGISDRDHLDAGLFGVREDLGADPRAGHPRLVEQQHGPFIEAAGAVEVVRERVERSRRDAGDVAELPCCARRRCSTNDLVSGVSVGVGEDAHHRGLSGPGERLHGVDPVPAGHDRADGGGLVIVQRWLRPCHGGIGKPGCTPRISAMNPSPPTDPPASIPSARSPAPSQTPGVSPRLA
jgi:hypothetical protein